MTAQPGKLVRQTDIPVQIGQPTPQQARKWLSQQVVYKNFAGLHDDLDNKVASAVNTNKEQYRSRMGAAMERWSMIWEAVNGNVSWGELDDDIHVPETKKAMDGKIARIEEALFEFDPIFEAEGTRGDLPRWKAQIITSYVFRMMEMGNYRNLVQPCARDGEICNVEAVKLSWETIEGMTVERTYEMRHRKNGEPYYHDERRIREAVVKQGVRYEIVDPFWLMYDIDAAEIEDCSFVGDESLQFMHVLEQQARNGHFSKKNMKLVKERDAGGNMNPQDDSTRQDWPDQYRKSRSIATAGVFAPSERGQHQAKKIRCIEMWMWFDFGDGFEGVTDPLGRKVTGTHQVVITTAAGVVIQFRLNPFDRKFVPYAISRVNRNGHEMVAPSPFEQVIQVNASYDRYQSNVMRHSDLSVAPWLAVKGEFPTDSLLNLRAGQVIPNAGDVHEIKISDVPQSVSYFHQYFRREIEESSGNLRVFESPQGTATETERKVQEQQRMVRSSIRANAELFRQIAVKTYWLCAQYSTGPQRFSVSGKASAVLGKSFEITPDMLQEDIDVRFLGLDNLHVYGNRIAGMAQVMNRWGPLLATMPGVNIMALFRQDFELTVGKHGINEVFPNSEPAWSTWPQTQENEMLLAGKEVPISERDDHKRHIEEMEPLIKGISKHPTYVQSMIRKHVVDHMDAYEKQLAQEEAEQREADQKQKLLGTAGGVPGVDKPPGEGGMEAGAKKQQGVTPGPPQARTVAKTGRDGDGMNQSQQAKSA